MGEGGSEPLAVLGAGPAGLTAGYVLARSARPVVVFEADEQVGGLARTVVRDGYRFDLGGHRFFTKSDEVQRLWEQVLGEELLVRDRMSRIYWRGRFIDYPLRLADVVRKVGPVELARCSASYALALARAARRRRAARRSRTGSATASAGACSSCSSRAIPRRSGACRRRRSAPSGRRSGSARCRSRASSARRC